MYARPFSQEAQINQTKLNFWKYKSYWHKKNLHLNLPTLKYAYLTIRPL